jgi:probable F420-dependent oxidoreductase
MKIGVNVQNGQPWTSADTIAMLGARVEELGFDSVWVSDHVVIPERIESVYPYGPPGSFTPSNRGNFFEPLTVLAYLAGRTRLVQLGVSVLVVPQRQPLVAAKQWATLDTLSGGRTILGVGAGWMREEFAALGADTFERRGAALDEAIRLFRAIWSRPGPASFDGQVYRFPPIRAEPRPLRTGGPPIWIGGHGRRSLRRAAELGDGWQGIRMDLDELDATRATMVDLLGRYGRRPEELDLAMTLASYAPGARPAGPPAQADLVGSPSEMAERVGQYVEHGIRHVLLQPQPQDSPTSVAEAIEFFGREVRPQLAA